MPVPLPPPATLRDRFERVGQPLRAVIWAGALAVLVALPWMDHARGQAASFFDASVMTLLLQIVIFSIAALGLNVVTGYTGQLNLGFVAFLAIGAYTCGYLLKFGAFGMGPWPVWMAMPAAVVHAGFWGVILGLPTLRLTGDYFAIVTFGFAELTVLVARNWDSVTGGPQGLKEIPRAALPTFGITQEPIVLTTRIGEMGPLWAFAVVLLALTALALWRITQSRVGRAWRAIREDEIAAQSCGIDLRVYKSLAFFVSAAAGGLAGSLLPILNQGVFISQFIFITSVYILAYVVFGGMGSLTGSVAGAAILMALLEGLRRGIEHLSESGSIRIDPEVRFMVYGVLLIAMARLRPEGLFPSRRVAGELHPESQAIADAENCSLHELRNPTVGRLT